MQFLLQVPVTALFPPQWAVPQPSSSLLLPPVSLSGGWSPRSRQPGLSPPCAGLSWLRWQRGHGRLRVPAWLPAGAAQTLGDSALSPLSSRGTELQLQGQHQSSCAVGITSAADSPCVLFNRAVPAAGMQSLLWELQPDRR